LAFHRHQLSQSCPLQPLKTAISNSTNALLCGVAKMAAFVQSFFTKADSFDTSDAATC
jgi:hypothetical protein